VFDLKIFSNLDLSFSGLPKKRTVLPGKEEVIPKIVAAFQDAVVDVLVSKAIRAVKDHKMKLLVVAGGVASNSVLRDRLKQAADAEGIRLIIPDRKYCTDNAVMIGIASIRKFKSKEFSSIDMNAVSRWS
jgi:N6-L-threonylcarbamoyladenine synthase